MALRWKSVMNVGSGGGRGGEERKFRVLASLLCNSSGSLLVPAANAIFFVGDRVSGTGNPVVERLSQLENIAAALQPKLGQAVNLWVMEPSHYMGPFACYENMLPDLTASGEPMGYNPEGLPAAHGCLGILRDCVSQVREAQQGKAGQSVRQELSSLSRNEYFDKTSPFEPFLDPSHTTPATILLGFSKGGVVLNQLLAEIVHSENSAECNASKNCYWDKVERHDSAGVEENKNQVTSARLHLLPSSVQAFLRSVEVVHYVDVGLNCPGAYQTDRKVLEGLAKVAGSKERGGLHVGVHGTPRQWEDRNRRWIRDEKDRCVEILRAAAQTFGGGKLNVKEKLYFPSRTPDLQMHFEIIDVLDLN